MSKEKLKTKRGITLIALVITIIVMLILIAATVTVALNGGLFSTAKKAVSDTQTEKDKELASSNGRVQVDGVWYDSIDNYFANTPSVSGLEVTVDGETVTLTPENLGEYIGKKVTNYKKGEATEESITIGEESYTVSTEYYLYYVDFGNKYGDGAGTIYLKARSNSHGYSNIPTTEELTEADLANEKIKIKNLNPALFAEGVEPPSFDNNNMKMVRWLTNTEHWDGLRDTSFSDKINYVVGAPSLEMFVDSYTKRYEYLGFDQTINKMVFKPGTVFSAQHRGSFILLLRGGVFWVRIQMPFKNS